MTNDSRWHDYEGALAAARRGATLLDEKAPGWRQRVTVEALDVSSCSKCVLGQVFGDYLRGSDALFATRSFETRDLRFAHGFNASPLSGDEGYDLLTKAWREVLAS